MKNKNERKKWEQFEAAFACPLDLVLPIWVEDPDFANQAERNRQRLLLLKTIIDDEGFRAEPYQDTRGVWTFGFGFTSLSHEESCHILSWKLAELGFQVQTSFPREIGDSEWAPDIRRLLIEMAYQMGLGGLRNFKRFRAALRKGEYASAADELLYQNPARDKKTKSAWHQQTPARCRRAANRMRKIGNVPYTRTNR